MSLNHVNVSELSSEECISVREILDRVGDRWSIYIVAQLREGPQRFNSLKRSIEGISQRMLTRTLRGLERDGLISRTVYPTNPPQVEYELTPLGASMAQALMVLLNWADDNRHQMQNARAQYDARANEFNAQ